MVCLTIIVDFHFNDNAVKQLLNITQISGLFAQTSFYTNLMIIWKCCQTSEAFVYKIRTLKKADDEHQSMLRTRTKISVFNTQTLPPEYNLDAVLLRYSKLYTSLMQCNDVPLTMYAFTNIHMNRDVFKVSADKTFGRSYSVKARYLVSKPALRGCDFYKMRLSFIFVPMMTCEELYRSVCPLPFTREHETFSLLLALLQNTIDKRITIIDNSFMQTVRTECTNARLSFDLEFLTFSLIRACPFMQFSESTICKLEESLKSLRKLDVLFVHTPTPRSTLVKFHYMVRTNAYCMTIENVPIMGKHEKRYCIVEVECVLERSLYNLRVMAEFNDEVTIIFIIPDGNLGQEIQGLLKMGFHGASVSVDE